MEITLSKLRSNLKVYCDKAVADRQPVRVRRRNGDDVILVAAEEYDSMAETLYLLSSPRNAKRLRAALVSAMQNKTKPMTIEELRAAHGI